MISLLTDFGHRDIYVGVMKGVIASIAPGVGVVDLCHEVGPGAIVEAAWLLETAWPHLPAGTVNLVVVDPGVGSQRAIVALRAAGQTFLAPDNGVLSLVARRPDAELAVRAERPDLCAENPSATFHGRDIFAPLAAHLANGLALADLGSELDPADLVRADVTGVLDSPQLEGQDEPRLPGRIVHIDGFGNLVTNVAGSWAPRVTSVEVGGRRIAGLSRTYSDQPPGTLLALVGSSGSLEICLRDGSAAESGNQAAAIGDAVLVSLAPAP